MPVSAGGGTDEVLGVLRPGERDRTFGANPLACAVGREVLHLLTDGRPVEESAALGDAAPAPRATPPQGDTGPKGETGAPGTAVTYARVVVTAGGATIDAAHSKGVAQANVTRAASGMTCFKGLAFTPKTAVGSADLGDVGNGVPTLAVALAPSATVTVACGGDGQAVVVTTVSDFNEDSGYYVIFE